MFAIIILFVVLWIQVSSKIYVDVCFYCNSVKRWDMYFPRWRLEKEVKNHQLPWKAQKLELSFSTVPAKFKDESSISFITWDFS